MQLTFIVGGITSASNAGPNLPVSTRQFGIGAARKPQNACQKRITGPQSRNSLIILTSDANARWIGHRR